jgi:methionyl-tRNA synthetase
MSSALPNKFFLTTPIYYVNARPHIGHAYTTIVADVLARRSRAQGVPTFFLTGTDEHGQKIERSAAAAGIPPQQFTDQVSATFREPWRRMGLTFDDFIRTTEPRHKRGVQKLFTTIQDNGFIYLDTYTGAYCVSDEAFVDVEPGQPCPECRNPTEPLSESNFYFKLSEFQQPVIDLIESNELLIEPATLRNEVLSFVRSGLKDLSISRTSIKWGIPVPGHPDHVIYVWLDALANYMTAVGYGSDAPEDIAKFAKWWPADLHLIGKEIARFHCVYWPAFLLAAGLVLPKRIAANGWLLFQDSKMSKSKGNVVRIETILDGFGALCPAPPLLSFRSEAEESASQPEAPHTSTGDIDRKGTPSGVPQAAPLDLSFRSEAEESASPSEPPQPTKAQQDLFASDILRYFLLREVPFGQDGNFSLEAMVTRYNADLANGYGNLVSRVLSLIRRYQAGEVVGVEEPWLLGPQFGVVATEPLHRAAQIVIQTAGVISAVTDPSEVAEQFQNVALDRYTSSISARIKFVDVYLSSHAPWNLLSTGDHEDLAKAQEVLYTAAESIRIITALLYPILPYATASVWRQLGLGDIELAAKNGDLKNLQWGGLKPGTKLGPLSPIFPRADKGIIALMNELESQKSASSASSSSPEADSTHPAAGPRTSTLAEPNPGAQVAASTAVTTERAPTPPATDHSPLTAPTIGIEDFAKIELRVAKILVAERIPKADKLLRLEVDLGYEKRQILSGIAEWYTPEELIGRRIVVITNLAPRKMRGLESHGMLLAASHGDNGKPVLATFADADEIPLGSRLK